ncbi:cytochrome c oxidase assembly protein [Oceanobacillus senegalensis]|uniref:cytochrome c oxidase assembly protein n=1 Tax=Oceanobacillus senegalensis TaxID=1936063 RepID=UPI000A307C6A
MWYEAFLLGELVWNFPLSVFLIGIAFFYFYILKHYTTIKLYSKPPLLFLLALCILYLILGTPLSAFSHLSFSLHMLQMSILYFIIPPLILAGIPEHMFKMIVKIPLTKIIGKLFLTPKLALFLFSLLFMLYHLPVTLRISSQIPFIQNGILSLLFILSFSLWWPIVSPDTKQRLYKKQKRRYLFLSGILLMPACFIFIWNAWIAEVQNPFLNQITAQLCVPIESNSMNLFPSLFRTKYDQIMAGTLMLAMHKLGMILSSYLGNTEER